MTIFKEDGFENGLTPWRTNTNLGGTIGITTVLAHHGINSLIVTSGPDNWGGGVAIHDLASAVNLLYVRVYFNTAILPTTGDLGGIIQFWNPNGHSGILSIVSAGGGLYKLHMKDGTGMDRLSNAFSMLPNTFYELQLMVQIGVTGHYSAWFSGTKVLDVSAGNNTTIGLITSFSVGIENGWLGAEPNHTIYIDCTVAANAYIQPEEAVPPAVLQASVSPSSQTAQVGQNLTFNVAVTGGTPPYSLQWYANGSPLTGKTGTSVTITSDVAQTVTLFCRVIDSSSPANIVDSNQVLATFTFVPPPTTLLALHTSGRNILDVNGTVVVLKGFCVPASGDNWYYRKGIHTAYSDFAAMHVLGANCVRYAINENWLDPTDYVYSSDNTVTCDDLVSFAANHGLYIILDMHYYKGEGSGSLPTNIQDWVNTWIAIAQRYKNSPNVLFELFNEPGGTFAAWRAAAQSCLDAIRNTGAQNIVLIDGFNLPSGGGANELLAFNSGNQWLQNVARTGYATNVIYTVHQYVTGYGASPPSTVAGLDAWFKSKGWDLPLTQEIAPILVGEFNVQHGDSRDSNFDGTAALTNFDNFMTVFDNWGASYTPWCWIAGPDVNIGWTHEYLLYNDFAVLAQNGQLVVNHLPLAPTYGTLTISANAGGTTNPAPGSYNVAEGSSVAVRAVPNSGYRLARWVLNGTDSGNAESISFIMSGNPTLQAVFEVIPPPPTYTLFISAGSGGTTGPAPGAYQYGEGTIVNVAPIPDNGYRFANWTLDGQAITDNPINVTMNADHSLNAIFEALPPPPPEKQYLTIASVNGQTNPTAGTYEIDKNTSVTVTCTPNSGYRFKEWLLDNISVSTASPYVVLMDANHGLVAVCEAIPPPPIYTLFISASIGGTTHPSIGTYEYVEGTIVNVAPIPDNGYRFANWTLDGQAITDNPINVTMNADHSLNAIFETLPPPPPEKQYLTIVAINGQTNPVAGTYELDKNSSLTVTATPNTGYTFKHWLVDNVIAGLDPTITVVMDANHTLVAVCEAVSPTPRLWTWPFLTWLRNLIRKGE
jgi:hypothetical protein